MNTAVQITNTISYTTEMAKSLIDKIYFLDKVDAGLFVDFGCADGIMLDFISKVFPGIILVGYDNDDEMIEKAKVKNAHNDVIFTSSWEEVAKIVSEHRDAGTKSCLVLSSVIHEVHSYLSQTQIDNVWKMVWGTDTIAFDYIAIRDMMVSRTTTRPSDSLQVARVRQLFDIDMLDEWEANWGGIEDNWSLTHFLLTYRYKENWTREVKENYLPVSYEKFMASVPKRFTPIFKEHFTLPFLRRKVREDFGFELADRTHLKLILERF